ncbi:hypothetical protein K491DRAFT_781925 [Lophiostoma macrostomum CBS 122681]|uniref:Uncharacterized protein n=1 Tax=Lophiostoma macrostomum CBS 122681 TaxID=1314788 RepID=A0A6A6SUV5_9PLEO|nr:hypothetical protein K491DRAFT_781925 [Lophiostoma macrostomum CBS 122681]
MRLTRAASRAEAPTFEDSETPNASKPHTDLPERVPLGEVSVNAVLEPAPEHNEAEKMPPKKSKAKGGAKKGAKGKKGNVAEEEHVEVVLEDERQAAGSPASDAAVDELANPPTGDIAQVPMSDQRPASPPSRAVRMTRRQLAKQEEELSKSQRLAAPPTEPEVVEEIVEAVDPREQEREQELPPGVPPPVFGSGQQDIIEDLQPEEVKEVDAELEEAVPHPAELRVDTQNLEVAEVPVPEITSPRVEVTSEPEPKVLTSEKPCESEQATPAPSRTPSRSPSKSPAKTPMRLEESFEAIDALEEALENVIPSFNPPADEKSPRKAKFDASIRSRPSHVTKKSPMATSKASRNPSVPKSLKQTAPRKSLARASSVRVAPSKEARKGSNDVADYLASKRRPISMSFPTPPPPSKSTKAPTTSTFQLPGEAVAAKLKAQREERLKREAEQGGNRPGSAAFVAPAPPKASKPPTKPTFQLSSEAVAARLKAQKEERLKRAAEGGASRQSSASFQPPPPPKPSKPPTVPSFQLPGEAIAAKLKVQKEERLKREAEGSGRTSSVAFNAPPPPKSTKPPTVANFQLPGEAIAAKLKAQKEERLKREEEEAVKKPAFKARPAPTHKSNPAMVRQTAASKARESIMNGTADSLKENAPLNRTGSVSKRNSTLVSRTTSISSSANTSKRNSVVLNGAPLANRTVTQADAAAQRVKAREIFNRDKMEKVQRENERREKEEAAKKARAEAAERGRIASREWAEKQKRKLAGGVAGAATKAEAA